MEKNSLVWRRSGLEAVSFLGVAFGLLLWSLTTCDGLEKGFSSGIQRSVTGQAEILTQGPSLDDSFTLEAMVKELPGVVSLSERGRFSAEVLDNTGTPVPVNICSVSFFDETKVTDLGSRIHFLDPEDPPSLVVPDSWKTLNLLRRDLSVGFHKKDPEGKFWTLPISGYYTPVLGQGVSATLYMGMNLARRVFGSDVILSEIALKLDPKIDPEKWVSAHKSDFRNMPLSLVTWKEAAKDTVREFHSRALGFYAPLILLALLISVVLLLFGWNSRSPRSGLALAVLGGFRTWLGRLGYFFLVVLGTLMFLFITLPAYQGLLLSGFGDLYPTMGTKLMSWGWDWFVIAIPVVVLGTSITLSQWKPRLPRRPA